MNVTGRGGSAVSASAKMALTSSGVAWLASSWPPGAVLALAYAVFSTTSRPPSCTTTAPTLPSCPGRSTTRSERGGGRGVAQATAPARTRPERRRRRPRLRRASARTNDELRAAHAEDRRRRLDAHGIGRLLGDATGDHRERALGKRRLDGPRLVRLVDESLDHQHAVRSSRQKRVVGQRDPDGS